MEWGEASMQAMLYRPYASGSCTITMLRPAECSGIMTSRFFHKSTYFYNEWELIEGIDSMLNQVGGPQEAFTPRNFLKASRRNIKKRRAEEEMADTTNNIIPMQPEAKATFVIDVQYRQHASWQGTITWAEKGETRRFRSVLEMLRLMSEAQPEQETVDWKGEE